MSSEKLFTYVLVNLVKLLYENKKYYLSVPPLFPKKMPRVCLSFDVFTL
jgi:hypothetical protein